MAMAMVCHSLSGCYDDSLLINEMEQIKDRVETLEQAAIRANEDIVSLQTMINAMMKNVYVSSVETTHNGYIIKFSDGTSATISNGADGIDGTSAPAVSIMQDPDDSNYYWTIDGEWLLVNGNRVQANSIMPQVRINEETKEWEVSTDGGKTWQSTGFIAEGQDGAAGDSIFEKVDASNPDYVVITLTDCTEFRLARYDESKPLFMIKGTELVKVEYGKRVSLAVEAKNIADYIISTPQGWKASYSDAILTITAPTMDQCHYDIEGVVAVTVVSDAGKTAIFKINVIAVQEEPEPGYELRVLSFEDKDARFTPYCLDYAYDWAGAEINTWSDLIDEPQYGGPLTYADYMSAMYTWYDEGNTELTHTFPDNYAYCYWGGGHAISNYWGEGFDDKDRDRHIAKYYGDDYVTENAGNDSMLGWFNLQFMIPVPPHSGDNFAVHYGYKDFFTYVENLPEISFGDGQTRVVDHMFVTNTNYTLNQLYMGVKSEAGNSFGGNWTGLTEDAWLKIVAYGFENLEDEEYVTETDFYLVQGEDVVTSWEKWDLSSLGKVAKVRFNFLYSEEMGGKYGFTIPGYFAYDDVAVRFDK